MGNMQEKALYCGSCQQLATLKFNDYDNLDRHFLKLGKLMIDLKENGAKMEELDIIFIFSDTD